jgi:hypothetical protein
MRNTNKTFIAAIAHLYRLAAAHGHHWATVMSEAEAVAAASTGGVEEIRRLCASRTDDSEHHCGYIDGPPGIGQSHTTATGRVMWCHNLAGVRWEVRRPLPDGLAGHVVVLEGNSRDHAPARHTGWKNEALPEWAEPQDRHYDVANDLQNAINGDTLPDTSLVEEEPGW